MLVKDNLGLQILLPRAVIAGQKHQALGIELPVFHLALYQLKYDATFVEQVLPDLGQKTLD